MGARAVWVRRAPVPPSEAGEADAGAERTAPHARRRLPLCGPLRDTGPGLQPPTPRPALPPSPCPLPSQNRGASGGCSRTPLATGAGKTLASLAGARYLGFCGVGSAPVASGDAWLQGGGEPPAIAPQACPAMRPNSAERPQVPRSSGTVTCKDFKVTKCLGPDGTAWTPGPHGIHPSWVQPPSQNFFRASFWPIT